MVYLGLIKSDLKQCKTEKPAINWRTDLHIFCTAVKKII